MWRAVARSMASKMTALGSPPSLPRTNSAPLRSAHVPSCSAAAARNVSPAAISTDAAQRRLLGADLADGGGLADAVDADEQPHVRARRGRSSKCSERSAPDSRSTISACSASSSCVRLGDLLRLHPGPQAAEQIVGDAHADVGAQQRLLEVVPGLVG